MNLTQLEHAFDFQTNYEQYVKEAADYIKKYLDDIIPEYGITLGSGLGDLADKIEKPIVIDYKNIPHFPVTTVAGHEGKLIIGNLKGVKVIGLKGRKHFYEVADEPMNVGMLKTVFAVNVLAELGIKNYFVTNASGGLNVNYQVGDVMIINSHINSFIPNPLIGRKLNFKRVDTGEDVWRFEPMNNCYDPDLRIILKKAGEPFKEHVFEGVYSAVSGCTYETKAESQCFRNWGIDAIGMSTTPEVIMAKNRGMKVVGMSCITNVILEDGTNATSHEEVKATLDSEQVKTRLSEIVTGFFRLLKS